MTTLVVGASGATGRLLVEQLLDRGHAVRVIVRAAAVLPESYRHHGNLTVVRGTLLDLTDAELARHVADCGAVASCLGHTLSLRGVFGPPRRLVTEAVRRLCAAIRASQPDVPARFVLMNTVANRNRDLAERVPAGEAVITFLLRHLLPPHADNEQAADYLRVQIGRHDPSIEWVAVRPDSLVKSGDVTAYDVHPSPLGSPIFRPGITSRINVAHFMAELITNDDVWRRWKGQMPVIYNRPS